MKRYFAAILLSLFASVASPAVAADIRDSASPYGILDFPQWDSAAQREAPLIHDIRVAGNVISPGVAGSIQYAYTHLETRLMLVLGHEGCGAVQAALAAKFEGAQEGSHIQWLLQTIQFPLDQQQGNVPAITSVSPNSGLAGSSVTIAGSNFGTTQGASVVRFNTTAATVTAWSASQITVTVPQLSAGPYSVTTTVNGVSSNAATFTVTAVTQPNYTFACPATLTVNRGANGAVTCTVTRTGGFTGSVAFTVSGLPSGVTASASPASSTGNSTVVTFTAGASATLGTANVTISAAATAFTTRTAAVALTVASGSTGGSVTATGAVASNSPWFAEEQVRLSNTGTLTALTVTLTVARNPASLVSSGQYNTIGGSAITQSVSTTSTQVVYTFTLIAGQSLPAGTGRTFAAQMSPGGTAHPTAGDSWSVTYTSGGSSTTTSGTF